MEEWGSHTQPWPAFCKMAGVMLLPPLENFVEGKHWRLPTSEWQWTKWHVLQDLTCSRQRRCRLGLNALSSPAFSLCSSTASLAWGLQAYNLLRVCRMQFPRSGERRKVHRNEVVWCYKRLCSIWIGREQTKATLSLSFLAKMHAGYPFAICLLTSLSLPLGWKWTQVTLNWRESATALQRASAHLSGAPMSASQRAPATALTRIRRLAAMVVSDHRVLER